MKTNQTTQPQLEAATVYLLPDHQIVLEELRLKLRRRGIKSNKSKLVRVAINFLQEQNIEDIISRLQLDRAE